MAIFNATPDSFSDGHVSRTETSTALQAVLELLHTAHPPAILDIGGMSTRPNSEPCSEEEELDRVVPLITSIRASSDPVLSSVRISIDTYRPSVALAAVRAGANCINDVRGGREEGMLEVMAKLDVPVVLMHSRGDSKSMTTAALQDYTPLGGVVRGVQTELAETVTKALAAGIKAWNIVLDPGLGFAKTQTDQIVLVRHLGQLGQDALAGYPLLVGASRKGFVGKIIGREKAAERGYGDAAVNAWCAASGVVDILRVHDALGAAETVKMTTAIKEAGGTM
jgi:dihydroneopterin aldolase/2-amino-4-hydroxy-6-hydroxymethyldihydropteridine diphosphokinase/dihydropteroate synthase